ncbi:MAG: HPr kinase/phosphorylase [Alphaproteobacteria bacterium]
MPKHIYQHASCVSIDGQGVLLLGKSGAGKSDLALRLIHAGAMLVADDQVMITLANGQLLASSPEKIIGLIEARGVGLLTLHHRQNVPLVLAVKLVERKAVSRLPEPTFFDCFDLQVPLLSLHAFDDSVCAKIFLYLVSHRS